MDATPATSGVSNFMLWQHQRFFPRFQSIPLN
jgi:hypothetical protein